MRRRRLLAIPFGLLIVALLTWLRLADPYPVQALRDVAFDGFQRIAPREPADAAIRIIDIDEQSLAALGQWPWPRDILATIATRLTELGAAAVVFDVLFPEPDRMSPIGIARAIGADLTAEEIARLPDYDAIFATALANSPSVLGFSAALQPTAMPVPAKSGFAVVGPNQDVRVAGMPGAVMSLPSLVSSAYGLGSISLEPAGTVSTIRRLPLLWKADGDLYPSLAIEALRVALGVTTTVVFTDQTGFGFVESVRVGPIEIPTTPDGQLWLYFQPTPPDLYIPAMEILGDNWTSYAGLITGNIVFIGSSAEGLRDIRGNPLGQNMPGVEFHVQALQQILAGDYLERSDLISGIEILAFVIIGIVIVLAIMVSGPLVCLLIGGGLAVAVAGASWIAFRNSGYLFDPSFPLLGGFTVYSLMIFFQFAISNADRRKIRGAFSSYVSPQLLHKIERSSGKLQLGGETRELSIMFSDVRGFTTLSEGFKPPDLVALLNTMFGALGQRITEQNGTIDKFIGDAIMAFWNAPVDVERHAYRACLAALGMRETLAAMNKVDAFKLRSGGHAVSDLNIGIGIATGEVLVGNLGLESRFDYSCIGDSVNIASRVESACKTVGYDILVVEETRAAAAELAFLEAGSIELKGKSNREAIHLLVGGADFARTKEFVALRAAHSEAMEALRHHSGVDAAIDRCIGLVTFPDPHLCHFYDLMRKRRTTTFPLL